MINRGTYRVSFRTPKDTLPILACHITNYNSLTCGNFPVETMYSLRRSGYKDPLQRATRRKNIEKVLELLRSTPGSELTVREVHIGTGISEPHLREILPGMCLVGKLIVAQSQRPRTYKLRPLYPMPLDLVERMQRNLSNVPEEALTKLWEHSYRLSSKTSVTDVYEKGERVRSKFRVVVGDQLAASESALTSSGQGAD